MKKPGFLILAAVIIILLFLGWNFFGNSVRVKEMKMGLVLPLSGILSDYGSGARDAAMLSINEFNESHKKIKVTAVIIDQAGDSEKTKVAVQDLIKDNLVMAIVGPLISSNTLYAGPVAQEGNITLISPSATNPDISRLGDYVFRTCPSDAWQGVNLADLVVNDLNYRKIAVLYQEDESYSKGLAEVFKEKSNELGGNIVAEAVYYKNDTEFEKQLTAIKERSPDVIFVPSYTKQGALIVQQMKKLNMDSIQFLGGDGVGGGEFITMAGEAAEGAIATAFFDPRAAEPAVRKFVEKFQSNYGKQPSWIEAHTYDAVGIILQAISNAEKLNRQEIRDLIAATKSYQGVTGSITFDENGDPILKKILKIKVENSEWVIFKE